MPVTRTQGGAILPHSATRAVRLGVQCALACLLSGSMPLLAAAQSAAPAGEAPAPAASAADTQQRLQRLEQSQQALQRQLQENAAEIEALMQCKLRRLRPAQQPSRRRAPPRR